MAYGIIDASPSGPGCLPGNNPADVTVTITDEDFQTLVQNPQANGTQLFFAARLKVRGYPLLVEKFMQILGSFTAS